MRVERGLCAMHGARITSLENKVGNRSVICTQINDPFKTKQLIYFSFSLQKSQSEVGD